MMQAHFKLLNNSEHTVEINIPPFKDGERIVFYGDSLTHGGDYIALLQLFYTTRYPDRKIYLINAGTGGASLAVLGQMGWKDVLSKKPYRVFMMFGMNDVGRNLYIQASPGKAVDEQRQQCLTNYKNYMTENIVRLTEKGISVVIMVLLKNLYQSVKTTAFLSSSDSA